MPEALKVSSRWEGNTGILETEGYINSTLNLEKSRIANSMGIAILIEVVEKMREQDGKVAFCCVAPTLAKTFQIMGLLKVADIYDTEAQAMQAMEG